MIHLLFAPLFPFLPFGPVLGIGPLLLLALLVWLLVGRGTSHSAPPMLSGDGRWWWDGRRWISAISTDGRWRWTGDTWEATS